MPVTLLKNKIRAGTFNIARVRGTFPTQAITSVNLDDMQSIGRHVDFKTKIVEMIEPDPNRLLHDSEYMNEQKARFSEMIRKNPKSLSLFTMNNLRTDTGPQKIDFTKKTNEDLIDFQEDWLFISKGFF